MKNILYINLKDKKVKIMHQYDEFKIKLNNNNLVFEAPTLAGYGIIGINRLSVYDKNSLSQSGSHFAHFMKCNEYDYLVFEGESEQPVYVYIDKKEVSIKDAKDIYKKDYSSVYKQLKIDLGVNDIEVACIGKAGVDKIDFSKIMFRHNKSCGKNGLGKLMGNKNLKAIVLKKHENLVPFDKEKLKIYNDKIRKRLTNKKDVDWYSEENTCYGCCINCKNTSIHKIINIGFNLEGASKINEIANFYGMDSITLANGIYEYKKIFDIQITNLEDFINNIMKNYDQYKPLFIKNDIKRKKSKKQLTNEHKIEICKFLLAKNILSENEKKSLAKCVLGLSVEI